MAAQGWRSHDCDFAPRTRGVQVNVHGVWFDGELLGHDLRQGRVLAHVRWSAGVGHEREAWCEHAEIVAYEPDGLVPEGGTTLTRAMPRQRGS